MIRIPLDWANSEALYVVADDGRTVLAILTRAEECGMLVSCLGDGTTIREIREVPIKGQFAWSVLWTEGEESMPAGESFDYVAETVYSRIERNDSDPTATQWRSKLQKAPF